MNLTDLPERAAAPPSMMRLIRGLLVLVALAALAARLPNLARTISVNGLNINLARSVMTGIPDQPLEERLARAARAEDAGGRPTGPATLSYLRFLTLSGKEGEAAAFLSGRPALLDSMVASRFAPFESAVLQGELKLAEAQLASQRGQWTDAVSAYRQAFYRFGRPAGPDLWQPYAHTLANYYATLSSGPDSALKAGLLFQQAGEIARASTSLNLAADQFSGASQAEAAAFGDLIEADRLTASGQPAAAAELLRGIALPNRGPFLWAQLRLIEMGEQTVSGFLEAWRPAVLLNAPVSGVGLLSGAEVLDPILAGTGAPLRLLLYWQALATPNSQKDSGQWFCDGSNCLQVVTALNLTADAGFEWPAEAKQVAYQGGDSGYWRDDILYAQADDAWEMRGELRMGRPTSVSCLDNDVVAGKSGRSGLVSRIRSPVPGATYLQLGWLRAGDTVTNALLGRMWISASAEQEWSYMAAGAQPDQWVQHGQLIQAPEQVQELNILAQNFDSPGRVCFDDLLLFRLFP